MLVIEDGKRGVKTGPIKLINEDNFVLACLVHRPLSCIDLDLWMEFGIEQAVQGWLQSQSDQCV